MIFKPAILFFVVFLFFSFGFKIRLNFHFRILLDLPPSILVSIDLLFVLPFIVKVNV